MLALALVAPACKKASAPASRAVADDSKGAEEGPGDTITNTQEQAVDEGGIVKAHGDHLVVLRRGRLFTVKIGDDSLRAVSYVDVTPHPRHDAWYDEMLVHDDTVVVVGYSYRVSATELGIFRIDDAGGLTYVDTYFLDSNDYYSSRNYASRLVGDQLIFYMPHYSYASSDGDGAEETEPLQLGRWKGGARRTRKHGDWERLMDRAALIPSIETGETPVVHSVITCDLSGPRLGCRARGIRGSYGRAFYVSSRAVYVWTHQAPWYGGYGGYGDEGADLAADPPMGALYRLPLGEGPIGAVHVEGAPIDQFSFKETADGNLLVLVQPQTPGDAMWGPEQVETAAPLHLVTLSPELLEHRGERAPAQAYRTLPGAEGPGHALTNRFVGDTLLYGLGSSWGYGAEAESSPVHVHHYAPADPHTDTLVLPHGIDRIEALGKDGLVVGTDGQNLRFTSLRLGPKATIAGRFVQPGAAQGELRSHGFFFRSTGEGEGVLGLPLRRWTEPGYAHLLHGSAQILYLGVDDLQLRELGTLDSRPDAGRYDACLTSCVDWYGNARPIFYRGRVFALMGYELVEGRVVDGAIEEVRRIDMSAMIGGGGLRHAG
ncbi:MAG: beta-propeller domain-containing protein [Myxococcales bacterium]|nr:beta-propeller domain-containing protein [Myxococcales bacterium]